jgi:hypothetical protein
MLLRYAKIIFDLDRKRRWPVHGYIDESASGIAAATAAGGTGRTKASSAAARRGTVLSA